jgi:hypothetical protein
LSIAQAALITSGIPILYAPVAIGLMLAALTVFAMLTLTLIALVTQRAWRAGSYRDLVGMAVAACAAAVCIIGMLSVLRLFAEAWLGIPNLT